MKKRAVLFLLVLCAVLCLALPAMAKTINITSGLDDRKQTYTSATAADTINMHISMSDVDMMSDSDWHLKARMEIVRNIIFNPQGGLYITRTGTLAVGNNTSPVIACDITNYGTIESGIYAGTITNYGTIIGGTFTGTVINVSDGEHQGQVPADDKQTADLTKATMLVQYDEDNQIDGTDDPSFKGAYITVTLKLDDTCEQIESTELTKKILRGDKIWTAEPTNTKSPETDSTVFAYWRKEGSTGTNDIYDHNHFYAPGKEVTVTPVWCDHVVKFVANKPLDTDELLIDWMIPQAFYKNGTQSSQCLSANKYVCLRPVEGKEPDRMWFLCWNTREARKGLNYPEASVGGEYMEFTPDYNQRETKVYARWALTIETGQILQPTYRENDTETAETVKDEKKNNINLYTLRDNMFEAARGRTFEGWLVQGVDHVFNAGDEVLLTQNDDDPNDVFPGGDEQEWNKKMHEKRVTINITAQWKNLPVTEITFDANGTNVTGYTPTAKYYMGETLPLPKNGFARTGYTFTSWNSKSDGTGTGYGDEANITIEGDELVDKNVTLYAQWQENAQPPTPTPTPTQRPVSPTPQPTNPPPQTGDAANQPLWLALCMASVAAMAALVVMKKRRFFQR